MVERIPRKVSRESIPEAGNTAQAVRIFTAQVREWTDRVSVNKMTVIDAEKEYATKNVPELESLVLTAPQNWSNIPERWLALVNVLEKKYKEWEGGGDRKKLH